MNLAEYGFESLDLLEGEDIVFAIDMTNGGGRPLSGRPEALLLTELRLIHLAGAGKRRQAAMMPLGSVDSVEVTAAGGGISAYLWAGLAFALSVILYAVIDHSVARIAAALAVFAMGVYLVVNQITDSGQPTAVFRAGGAEIRWPFDHEGGSEGVNGLINALHRARSASDGQPNRRADAPQVEEDAGGRFARR